VVWVHTVFEPTIHHLLSHITFSKPRLQLQDRSRKLSPEHVASPQWIVVVDLVIMGKDLRSTAQIFPLQINGSDLPFSIDDRDLLRDFGLRPFSWRYTSCNFEISNTRGLLIWNAPGISTADKIQHVCLYFKPEMSCFACCARCFLCRPRTWTTCCP
jgi:hypothetical protein